MISTACRTVALKPLFYSHGNGKEALFLLTPQLMNITGCYPQSIKLPLCYVQVAVVPIMSSVLQWRDTTILIIAVLGNITGQFLTSFSKSMGVLYFAYVLWMLWNTITTISRYTSSILILCENTSLALICIRMAFTF